MCIFSGTIRSVSSTRIYARSSGTTQHLVYDMRLQSDADLAMILPLPTQRTSADQAKFFDLSDYPSFFDDMERCFPVLRTRGPAAFGVAVAAGGFLQVQRVGAFDASFVPGLADFVRLDPRFRLREEVWSALPAYRDYGFAVFQLRAGDARVHPMALSFHARAPGAVYFPTTHVHAGTVPAEAYFDHSLYTQSAAGADNWERGSVLPGDVMDFGNHVVADRTRGLVEAAQPVVRRTLRGTLANSDVWLPSPGAQS